MDQRMAVADPANVDARLDVAYDLGTLAELEGRLGRLPAALEHAQGGVALLADLAARQPDNAEIALVRVQQLLALGGLLARSGDLAAAQAAWREAEPRSAAVLAADRDNAETRSALAESWARAAEARAQLAGRVRSPDVAGCGEARLLAERARALGATRVQERLAACAEPALPRTAEPRAARQGAGAL